MKLAYLNRVGVVTPPDELYRPVIYDAPTAEKQFRQDYHDIFQSEKKSKPANAKKMSPGMWTGAAITAAGIITALAMKLLKK